MKCGGCGRKSVVHILYVLGRGEICENCGGLKLAMERELKSGFMYKNKILKKNSNHRLAKKVRHSYAGDASDEVAGGD